MILSNLILLLDLAGTLVFAVTGAIRGVKTHLDIFGVTVLSCCVGVGGGIIRDLIIGSVPVSALKNQHYLIICIAAGVVIFCLPKKIFDHPDLINILDAFGLGVFTALGAMKAAGNELNFTGIVLCAVFTATGGGVIRDVLSGELPPVILKTDFYATASLIGAVIFYFLNQLGLPVFALFGVTAATVALIRLLAMHFHLQLPSK